MDVVCSLIVWSHQHNVISPVQVLFKVATVAKLKATVAKLLFKSSVFLGGRNMGYRKWVIELCFSFLMHRAFGYFR